MPRLALLAFVLFVIAGRVSPVEAQQMRGSRPATTADLVSWGVRSATAARGADAKVILEARIAPGWRLYALDATVGRPLTVTIETTPEGVTVGSATQSTPRTGHDPAFGEDYTYFVDAVRLALPVRVARSADAGRHAVVGTIRYAVCNDSICLPPAATPFRAPLTVR